MDTEADATPAVLTIAGSDPSGGAGIQADLKTCSSFGVYGMTALTCLTIGNTQGVTAVEPIDADVVRKQISHVVDDIPPDAVKTGMLWNGEIISAAADKLKDLSCPLVIDPVMVTKRGDILLSEKDRSFYRSHLLPLAEVVTPNIPEAELLTGDTIQSPADMKRLAKAIYDTGSNAVIIKSGHSDEWEHSNDLLFDGSGFTWLESRRIHTKHTHGAGDAFSAAIASLLARGKTVARAGQEAKEFISDAILSAPELGKGEGPVNFNQRFF